MIPLPYIADRRSVADATDLIATHGPNAAEHAAVRADHSRDIGNHIHFCHWRQIERLILLLATDRATGSLH